MAAPLLLVHDDTNAIATIRRMLAREGFELVIATSAADAIIAFGHHLPALILLAPSVESDRGRVVLDELANHPDGQLAKVLLLGESIPGFGFPVVPMPPDSDFVKTIEDLLDAPAAAWTVREHAHGVRPPEEPIEMIGEAPPPEYRAPVSQESSDGWRAAPPPNLASSLPEPTSAEKKRDLAGDLFGDLPSLEDQLHKQVEAEAMASVESSLQSSLQRESLENELPAEPARKRRQPTGPAPKLSPTLAAPSAPESAPTPPPPSTVDLDALEQRRQAAALREAELQSKVQLLQDKVEAARSEWADAEALARGAVDAAQAALVASQKEAAARQHTAGVEVEQLKRDAAHSDDLARQEREQRARVEEDRDTLEHKINAQALAAQKQVEAAGEALKTAEAFAEEARSELGLHSKDHEAVIAERDALKQLLDDEANRSRDRSESAAALEMKLLEQRAANTKIQVELEHERGSLATAEAHQAELMGDITSLEAELEKVRMQLELERESSATVLAQRKAELEDLAGQRAEQEKRTAEEQQRAAVAEERAKQLEDRLVLPLSQPGKAPLGVPRTGSVSLGELARLVAQLVLASAEVRIELGVSGGTRNLWLKRGALVASESTLPYETLADRARRDGLIDARQEADLRSVRGASPTELLEVMRSRGLVRDAEAPGLVQRYTEAVALDAFTEPSGTYRLHEEGPGPEVLAAQATRPVLPLVAEALRRALPAESQLEMLGGSEAVPLTVDSELDVRGLGFSERERRMLGFVDGEATVEDIVMAAGLKPERAYKTLAVAKFLGLIEVRAPEVRRALGSPELDVQRLDAKYEQVQDADYFTILGLGRNAGADEVQRSFDRLAEEFDPIRYSGHPDPALQQRAQVVHRLLEEAARALEDDRRRADYARHLLD